MRFKRLYIVLILALGIVFKSCKDEKKVIKQTQVSFKKEGELTIFKSDSTQINLDIEIADTDFDIQTGLMYRNSMKNNQGMLFVFDDEQPRSFYMKNTQIPLDLIYINDNKTIVSFQKNTKPFDESSLPSIAPAKYVLEVNAGLTNEWIVIVGDSIDFNQK